MTPSSPLSDPGQSDLHPKHPAQSTQPDPSSSTIVGKSSGEIDEEPNGRWGVKPEWGGPKDASWDDNHGDDDRDDNDEGEEGEEDRTIIGLTPAMTSTTGPNTTTTNATPGKIKISLRVRAEDDRAPEDRTRAPTRPPQADEDQEEDEDEDDLSASSITSSTIPYHDSPSPHASSEGQRSPPPRDDDDDELWNRRELEETGKGPSGKGASLKGEKEAGQGENDGNDEDDLDHYYDEEAKRMYRLNRLIPGLGTDDEDDDDDDDDEEAIGEAKGTNGLLKSLLASNIIPHEYNDDDDDDDDEEEDMEVDPVDPDELAGGSRMEVEQEGKVHADERESDEPPIRLSVKGIGTESVGGASRSGGAATAGTGSKIDTRGDDSASELTQISDDSDREDTMSEDDEDVDEDAAHPDVDEWNGQQQDVASVPPPNTKSTSRPPTSSSNTQPSLSTATSTAKPLSSGPATGNRKPSIFGSRSDEPEVPDDDNESELTDSEAESTTATPEYSRVVPGASDARDGFNGVSAPVALAEDPALGPEIEAVGKARRLSIANNKTDDEEKPYSPPKTAKKGILGRTTEGEIESVMSEEEEEDDDEGGQGMLVKDAVRRESEGKTKLTQDDEEEDEEDKVVAGESASLEERAASPSSVKSKQRVSATPAPSSTSHMVTNNLSSATTQTTLEALQSLLQIEVKFAALRDQLYVEKMDELSREEEVIADGSHPSLLHLHQILQDRRENLLHLAQLRLKQNELELVRVRESDKRAVMSWWQDAKDTLVRDEYESNARKKRRLDKDKADYEMVRPAPRALPPKIPTRQDAEARTYAWEKGPSITALMADEVSTDLAKIGVAARTQYRHAHARHPREAMPTYGRSGHGMGFTAEEQGLMVDTGSLMFDPTGGVNRPINGNSAPHHHHAVPAAVAPQAAPRHRQYATTPNVYDMHSQMQPRREGRQVPTSNAEPFDPRRRDRIDESGNALGGPSRDRSRRDIEDGRDPKRRKTDSNSPAPLNGGAPPVGHQSQHVSVSHRNGDHRMEVDARMQEERRQSRRSPSPKPNGQPSHGKAMHPDSSLPPVNGTPVGYGQPDRHGAANNADRRGWNYRWSGAGAGAGAGAVPRHTPGMAAARN